MIDATPFPDAEAALVAAVQAEFPSVFVSNVTPAPILTASRKHAVIVGYAGGGTRDWGEASANVGVNVYAETDSAARADALAVQDALASVSNDEIHHVSVGAGGGTSVPRQSPPFQRYFVVTVHLRGQEDDLS